MINRILVRHRAAGQWIVVFSIVNALFSGNAMAQTQEDLETITVTAQRRSESLSDVPISITALTQDDLASTHITSTNDLSLVTPGLVIESGGDYVQPTLRGITTTQTAPLTQANVATYLDGVYQQTTIAAIFELPDTQQIEVLEGPQGTLFGRNATGGAILIHTMDPSLTAVSGNALIRYGNYDEVQGQAFVGGPLITDTLAASVSVLDSHTGAYQKSIIGGQDFDDNVDTFLLRGKIRFVPFAGADFILTGLYSDRRDYDILKQANYMGNNLALALGEPAALIASQPWTYSQNIDTFVKTQDRSLSLRGNIDVGAGTFTTTSSYNKTVSLQLSDGDNSALALAQYGIYIPTESWTQEFLYATKQLGAWHAVGGVFLYYAKGGYAPLNVNDYTEAIDTEDRQRSYSVFGDVTYDMTEQLSLTAGVRDTYEDSTSAAGIAFGSSSPPPLAQLGRANWNKATPRASVQYKFNDKTNAYFTYSEGFKSGAFNATGFQTTPANPETVNAYEIGLKSAAISKLAVNAAAFYYDYKDLQVTAITSSSTNTIVQELTNAANAKIYGTELSAAWNLTEQFSLGTGGSYLHARYTSFPGAVLNVPTGFGGNTTVIENISGATMISSPTWSGHLTARYVQPTAIGKFDASVTPYFSSRFYLEPGDRVTQPSYHLLTASLAWTPTGYDNLTLRAWGKNLTDAKVIDSTVIGSLADSVHYQIPRTYGIEAGYKF